MSKYLLVHAELNGSSSVRSKPEWQVHCRLPVVKLKELPGHNEQFIFPFKSLKNPG